MAVPQAIEQVAFAYVNITTLFLSAHDVWEQAEELAQKGSGENGWKREGATKIKIGYVNLKGCLIFVVTEL